MRNVSVRPLRSLVGFWRRRDFGGLIFVDLRDRGFDTDSGDPDI